MRSDLDPRFKVKAEFPGYTPKNFLSSPLTKNSNVALSSRLTVLLMPMFLQLLEAETARAIFQDNVSLCNEVTERVVQHFVRCIETHSRHMLYLKFLQTIVKADGSYIRKCQDMVMSEVIIPCSVSSMFVCLFLNSAPKAVSTVIVPFHS